MTGIAWLGMLHLHLQNCRITLTPPFRLPLYGMSLPLSDQGTSLKFSLATALSAIAAFDLKNNLVERDRDDGQWTGVEARLFSPQF